MKPKPRAEFELWYAAQAGKEFHCRERLIGYCKTDVSILKRGCLAFRKLVLDQFAVDPFIDAMTIASMCMIIYRRVITHQSCQCLTVTSVSGRCSCNH